MNYLMLFEEYDGNDNPSRDEDFQIAKPTRIDYEEFVKSRRRRRTEFTEEELIYLQRIFDENKRKIYEVEYDRGHNFLYNRFTEDKIELPDKFYIELYSNTQNGELVHFVCYKFSDDWYYVEIYQNDDTYDGEDDETRLPGFREYWRCDEFDSLKILLDRWI